MRSPLTVRVSDGVRDQQVTRFVKGLRFTKRAPGGHHSASVQIDAPENLFGDLGPADRLFIYDGRNAQTVWDGYVENPGRVTVAGGARYDLSAMGGVVLALDNARAVVFVDREIGHQHWQKTSESQASQAGPDQSAVPTAGPAFKVQFMPGSAIAPGTRLSGMRNRALIATGQPLGMVRATVTGGKVDADWATYIQTYTDGGATAGHTPSLASLSTTPAAATVVAGVDFTLTPSASRKQFALLMQRTGGAITVADDLSWAVFHDIAYRPALQNATGAYPSVSMNAYVQGHDIVGHLIGSGMLQVDGAGATIETATAQIDQLAYLDGAKPHQILDDLALHEPDMLWEILESGSNGKHRFAYRAWPTAPRYEISGREFTESGGEVDLCNRIAVSWKDATGAEQTTIRTTTVEALGTRAKDAEPIALPDGQGSLSNAQRIGDETLAALNTPTRSGTAVIRDRIQDRLSGKMVMPWEIEPGYLVRVRDIGADLRLTEMTYEDANCAASLTLGSPTLTQAQRIARLK